MPNSQKKCLMPTCGASPATTAYHEEFRNMNPQLCLVGCAPSPGPNPDGSTLTFTSKRNVPTTVSFLATPVATTTVSLWVWSTKNYKQGKYVPASGFTNALKSARLQRAQVFDCTLDPGTYRLGLFGPQYAPKEPPL